MPDIKNPLRIEPCNFSLNFNLTSHILFSRCFEQAPSPISYRSLIDRYSFKGKCSVKKQSPFLGYLCFWIVVNLRSYQVITWKEPLGECLIYVKLGRRDTGLRLIL
jgi:hypothetical protein